MRTAPELDGLSLESVPRMLTRVHTWLATLRLRLAEQRGPTPSEFEADLAQLRRVGRTYATYAVVIRDEHSPAAAFVAANAYQLLHNAVTVGVLAGDTGTFLRRETVSSDVS